MSTLVFTVHTYRLYNYLSKRGGTYSDWGEVDGIRDS